MPSVGTAPMGANRALLNAISSASRPILLTQPRLPLPSPPAMASTQPNTTLYIKNLNDKVKKEELRAQLYALFTTYGRILDVVALKGPKMKGQAFLVFSDLAGATAALRGCEGTVFYDKPMVRPRLNAPCMSSPLM